MTSFFTGEFKLTNRTIQTANDQNLHQLLQNLMHCTCNLFIYDCSESKGFKEMFDPKYKFLS